jgi:hypothetical protein
VVVAVLRDGMAVPEFQNEAGRLILRSFARRYGGKNVKGSRAAAG